MNTAYGSETEIFLLEIHIILFTFYLVKSSYKRKHSSESVINFIDD